MYTRLTRSEERLSFALDRQTTINLKVNFPIFFISRSPLVPSQAYRTRANGQKLFIIQMERNKWNRGKAPRV